VPSRTSGSAEHGDESSKGRINRREAEHAELLKSSNMYRGVVPTPNRPYQGGDAVALNKSGGRVGIEIADLTRGGEAGTRNVTRAKLRKIANQHINKPQAGPESIDLSVNATKTGTSMRQVQNGIRQALDLHRQDGRPATIRNLIVHARTPRGDVNSVKLSPQVLQRMSPGLTVAPGARQPAGPKPPLPGPATGPKVPAPPPVGGPHPPKPARSAEAPRPPAVRGDQGRRTAPSPPQTPLPRQKPPTPPPPGPKAPGR
jgi:hypothetical protein